MGLPSSYIVNKELLTDVSWNVDNCHHRYENFKPCRSSTDYFSIADSAEYTKSLPGACSLNAEWGGGIYFRARSRLRLSKSNQNVEADAPL
jgi:hypothetical protein